MKSFKRISAVRPFTTTQLLSVAKKHTQPVYVYSLGHIRNRLQLCEPFPVRVRYAMKANPHPQILQTVVTHGGYIDASSSYEVLAALRAGVAAERIRLSSQQPAHNLAFLIAKGVHVTATSLHQLELLCAAAKHATKIGVRINPGFGSGADGRRNTGGVTSSFGIWYEHISRVYEICATHGRSIDTLHIHVGSGADPKVWSRVMDRALEILDLFPTVTTLDIGGGYKVHRFGTEEETNMPAVLRMFAKKLSVWQKKEGRAITFEIEPGTWLVAHAGVLLARVVDVVDTGKNGYVFAKLNTGMNDILRPAMYGASHEIEVLTGGKKYTRVVFVGHNCETGDILTPYPGDPNAIEPRRVRTPRIGDVVAIYDAGAYCASMRAHGYNSYPSAQEVFL